MREKVNKPNASLTHLLFVPIVALLILFVSACGSKLAGDFVGRGELHISSYDSGSYAGRDEATEDMTATLTSKSSSEYYLTFDEKSPLKCKLLLDNKNLEDNNTENDGELVVRDRADQSCEVRDKNGKVQAAKVKGVTGGTAPGAYASFIIDLEADGSSTNYKFSFRGSRK